ncbi:hypothetical protein AQ616_09415 [Oceanobacillus sp. E9]|uniref:hypothetical protein n=1 Tax=Oceanobacillus sp. E9 TaxID=1742575 RepID=UPI00084E9467|nr:hypothetical protein [Oceanobacillus sp. E9]OEH53996.1 hypothetical protein AQ616_09415 [Oceanobacillus sp. E9]
MESQAKLFFNSIQQIELITYNYSQNEYRKVLEYAFENNLKQIIFTTTIFKKLIEKTYEADLYLAEINFMECLDEQEFTEVKDLISEINVNKKKRIFINLLGKELERFANSESIDIKSIVIFDKEKRQKVELYNNGVIIGELDEMKRIKDLILSRIIW